MATEERLQESEAALAEGTPADEPSPSDSEEPMPEPGSSVQYDQPWLTSLLRPVLIALMAASLELALLAFLRRFVIGLAPAYTQWLVLLGVAAAIIGSVSTSWLAQPGQRSRRTAGYRAAELSLLLLITRLGIWATTATWPTVDQFFLRPMETLFDGYFILGAILVGLAWVLASGMTADLMAMALQPDDLYLARTFNDRWQDTARPVYTDRPAILRRFVARWVVGGILLVMLAAGSRLEAPEQGFFAVLRQHIDPVVVAGILIYFFCGLVLISQGQLALLRARWTLQKTPSSESILRNWPIYSLLLILAVGVVAALMPLGGTFRLAQILTFLIQAIYFGLLELFRFLFGLFLLLLALLTGEQPPEAPPPAQPIQPIQPTPPPPMDSPLPAWTGGLLFWLLTAALLGYMAYIYLSGRGVNFQWLQRLWHMLRERWSQLFGAYREWQLTRIRAREEADRTESQGKERRSLWDWLPWRRLAPEQQVRYFYLSLLERAQEAGVARRPAETPFRYAPRLAERVGEAPEDREAVQELTAAFVEVRYAGRPVEPSRVQQLRSLWQRLRDRLRRP
ncbi:DUF4129 domain-containing protein [Litorilinea aerophila]|uniref:DUF4129 domain-containing protein n=1 Tax=Litorilinea aerophila TaxID=1204385 RepID=A0A540VM40_9CHLR|nr:DUF4129 domain-containing protein [Litorilinea aerophila]MCC9074509.1 DUF4129 domain-containing protein [Litorilinea aerophila]